MSLADRVKRKRLELGMTQTEAAEKAGIRQQSWQSIEDGKTLKPRNIIGIAKALNCDASWLMNGGAFMPMGEVSNRRIPLISYIQAGALAEKNPIEAFDGDMEYILTDLDVSDFTFALRIEGDSMEPDFKAGDDRFNGLICHHCRSGDRANTWRICCSKERRATSYI